jgi:hypothetical protein
MEIKFNIPIKAKCIKPSDDECSWLRHDLEVGKLYDVEQIYMSSCHTSVYINGISYNSAYLEFYYKDKLVDIFKSPLFNPYLKFPTKHLIKVVE